MELKQTRAYGRYAADVAELTATAETHFGQPYAKMLGVFSAQCIQLSGVLVLLSGSLAASYAPNREAYWDAAVTGASNVLLETLALISEHLPPGPKRVEFTTLAVQIGKRSLSLVREAEQEIGL